MLALKSLPGEVCASVRACVCVCVRAHGLRGSTDDTADGVSSTNHPQVFFEFFKAVSAAPPDGSSSSASPAS